MKRSCFPQSFSTLRARLLTCLLFVLFAGMSARAQLRDSATSDSAGDTTRNDFVGIVQKLTKAEGKKSMSEFQRRKSTMRQEEMVAEMQRVSQKAKVYLKHGIDTTGISREIEEIAAWEKTAVDGILDNKSMYQSYRNLVTSSKLLGELVSRINTRKAQLDNYEKTLSNYEYSIDSLNSDSSLYILPDDSLGLMQFFQKYRYVAHSMNATDSAIKRSLSSIQVLQGRINTQLYRLNANIEEVESYQKQLSRTFFISHFPVLSFSGSGDTRTFGEVISVSVKKNFLVLRFYMLHHIGKIASLFILIFASMIFLRSLRSALKKENRLNDDLTGQLVIRYPLLSAMVIVINIFQFIFPDPPFIFNAILWTLSAIALAMIMRKFITTQWLRFWLIIFGLFLVACCDNMLLQASMIERWGMLLLAIAGLAISVAYMLKGKKEELREKLILWFIGLLAVFAFISVVANISGRYNLAKALLSCGYFSVVIGILFLWTVRLINEGLALASSTYTKQESRLFFVNFDKVGEKAPLLLYVLLVIGWFVLLGRNFYEYRMISEPLKDFFFADRSIGSYSFNIYDIVIFFVVLFLSVAVSRIISFFASDKRASSVSHGRQRGAGLGSWILLIRVSVIMLGLFLALAASGFPLDRITILLGALGVGVGLGLQGLVNNLVSGIVIAFEKPINVGDIVEISGQVGTMKSIGFRSSVISSVNGADMVIPNGDILNAHLINWTLGGNRRQLEILVQVAYGTDLAFIQQLLLGLLKDNEKVLTYPVPSVQFLGFENGSIKTQLLFWVHNYRESGIIKSEVISVIDSSFRANGIKIPLIQQDVYIHPEKKAEDGK